MVLEIEASAGEHIRSAAEKMVAALKTVKRVKCRFNDINLIADRTATVESIVAEFHERSKERAQAYRESPEGKAAEAEAERTRHELQVSADALMAELPHLNWNDPGALLDWLCAMEEPRDRIGVKVDFEKILHAFCQHGYEPDGYCGDAFNENDRWIYAAWIIGQAIKAVYVPLTRHFTEKWKAKFLTT